LDQNREKVKKLQDIYTLAGRSGGEIKENSKEKHIRER
jgi:hypothetical protein